MTGEHNNQMLKTRSKLDDMLVRTLRIQKAMKEEDFWEVVYQTRQLYESYFQITKDMQEALEEAEKYKDEADDYLPFGV